MTRERGRLRRPRIQPAVLLRSSVVAVCVLSSVSCAVLKSTSRIVPPPVYRSATKQELVDRIQRFASIQSMRASIEVSLIVRSNARDKETEYRQVKGALVTRRPGLIRTNAETPAGLAVVYDMVSDGETFQVHLPWRNRVYEGPTELTQISDNRAKNIRPQHMLDAIMLEPIGPQKKVLLDFNSYGQSGYQILHVVETDADGEWRIRRKYWFSRSDLTLARMLILDDRAEIVTDAWYRAWLEDNGLPYPQFIRIDRPRDGYRIEIEILNPGLNQPVPDESFRLELPVGIAIERIDNQPTPGG